MTVRNEQKKSFKIRFLNNFTLIKTVADILSLIFSFQ